MSEDRRRKLAEELQFQTERFRALIGSIADEVWYADRDGKVTLLNPAAERGLGLEGLVPPGQRLEQVLSQLEILNPDGRPRPREDAPLLRSLRGETLHSVEEIVRHIKTGERRYRQASSAPVRDAEGNIIGAVAVVRDVTEQRRAEAERERLLEEARRRAAELDATISAIAVGVIIYNPSGEIVRMNQVAKEILRYPEAIWKLPVLERLRKFRVLDAEGKPLDPAQTVPGRALRGETVRDVVEGVHPPGRGIVWISSSAAPIRVNAEFVGAVLAFTDITRLRQVTEFAQRRAAELQAIIGNMVDAVVVADRQGRVTVTNEGAKTLLGFKPAEDGRTSIARLVKRLNMRHLDGTPVETRETPWARALAGEVVQLQDHLIRGADTGQDIFVRTSAAPIRDEKGRVVGAVAISKDVTELIELDRLKDDFIRVAAHELKTPVAIVKGYAQALVKAPQLEPAQRNKMLDAINRGSDRITRIIEDLLDISQFQLGHVVLERERVDLAELVQSVMDQMAPTAPKHNLRLVKTEPVVVLGDRARLKQVVAHLVENAIKYSPQGGNVDVAVEVRDGQAVVSVRDYGVGIPRERQARIFERFYRAHTGTPYDYGGMGVGLYVSREIVRAHGGQMWFTSEEGQGSTFYFSLPLK